MSPWAIVALAAVPVALVVLTGMGAHERGLSLPLSVMAGLFFPIAWVVWYVSDEHPYRRGRGA